MNETPNESCFCTLALGKRYQLFAKQLALDLETYAPSSLLLVLTDRPQVFQDQRNVLAFKYRQQGIDCFHDKRLVIEKTLTMYRAAAFLDSDTIIINPIPETKWLPGITAGISNNIIRHNRDKERILKINLSNYFHALEDLGKKLEVSLEQTEWIHEAFFVVARDNGKEKHFLKEWDRIGRYLELKGFFRGEGNAIGLAAAKVGWSIKKDGWEDVKKVTNHLSASSDKSPKKEGMHFRGAWLIRRIRRCLQISRCLRTYKAQLKALRMFDFYYR